MMVGVMMYARVVHMMCHQLLAHIRIAIWHAITSGCINHVGLLPPSIVLLLRQGSKAVAHMA